MAATAPAGLDRFGRFVNRRELRALAARLEEGERALCVVEARAGRRGVLAVTDRSVRFLSAGLLRTRSAAWPHRDVLGAAVQPGVDAATLTVRTTAGPLEFTLRKAEAEEVRRTLRGRPHGPRGLLDFAAPPDEAERRARLDRLERMRARGSVTKAEYERARRALADEAGA